MQRSSEAIWSTIGCETSLSPERVDPGRTMDEGDVYGIIAHALDIETANGKRYPGVVRRA